MTSRRASSWACIFSALTGALVAGCATTEPGASAEIASGRRIYTMQCIACHQAYPVTDYSASEWPSLLDDMSERAKLSPEQKAQLVAYVRSAARGHHPGRN